MHNIKMLFGLQIMRQIHRAADKMYFDDILKAQKRIGAFIHKTPVITCSAIDKIAQRKVHLKCENFQKTGSFKARGALNAVIRLKEKDNPDEKGVVTHSSGNHGQALAWAAKHTGIPCSVVVPNNTFPVKINAIRDYGADIVFCEPNPKAREETCASVAKEKGQTIISPYNYYDVIAGQGTIALELLEQVPNLDAILVAVGGGGLSSGIALAVKNIKPSIKVFAVEPKGKELEECLKTGKRLWKNPPEFVDTIADGIRVQQVGVLNFPILCDLIEKEVFTVTNEEIMNAMKFAMQRSKLVMETSAAAVVAAVMSEKMQKMYPELQHVAIIICGGNVDLDQLPWC